MPGSSAVSRLSSSNVSSPYTATYSHVSSFRSPQLEVLLYSPHITTEPTSWATNRTIPIYGEHDVVGGKVILDPSSRSGRIVLTLTGTFAAKSLPQNATEHSSVFPAHRHVFFCVSRCIDVSPLDTKPPSSPTSIGRVFRGMRRKARTNTAGFETRTFSFAFDLGENHHTGKILPSTFSSSGSTSMPVELAYQVTATWEPLQLTLKSSILSIPVVLRPELEFYSLNAGPEKQESWVEIPLKSHRPVPVLCAVTLPSTLTFSRASSIPFFVIFTTSPRSPTLTREIATDATVYVSLSSHFFYQDELICDSLFPEKSLVSNHSADSRSSRIKRQVVKRMKSATSFWSTQSTDIDIMDPMPPPPSILSQDVQPPPPLPQTPVFSDTQTVYTGISIGFPKRPRYGTMGGRRGHPSLENHRSLPDGLFKDKIPLNRDMLPSINCGGITLKYFLDVSVLVGQDELRARILLRVT